MPVKSSRDDDDLDNALEPFELESKFNQLLRDEPKNIHQGGAEAPPDPFSDETEITIRLPGSVVAPLCGVHGVGTARRAGKPSFMKAKPGQSMGDAEIKKLLHRFKPNKKWAIEWLATPNGSFPCGFAPIELIMMGKGSIVERFIRNRLLGNPA